MHIYVKISAVLTSAPARQLHLYSAYGCHSQRYELVGNGQPGEVYVQGEYAEPYPVGRTGADELLLAYLKGHYGKDNDLFFTAVQNGCHDIFFPDLYPDDPGMVVISVPTDEKESGVDVYAPTECPVVRCASFRLSPVDRNNLWII